MSEKLGVATVDLGPSLSSKWRLCKVPLVDTSASALLHSKDLGHIHLVLAWEGKEQERLASNVKQLLAGAAQFIVDPLGGEDLMATPALHRGKAWAESQYYARRLAGLELQGSRTRRWCR